MELPRELEGAPILFHHVLDVRAPGAQALALAAAKKMSELARKLKPLQVLSIARRKGHTVELYALAASGFRRYRRPGAR